MKKVIFLAVLLVMMTSLAFGQSIIAYTSFEEPVTGDKYFDTGDGSTDHALVNNDGQASVNFTSTGGEIGFSAYYYNTLDSTGLGDGDYFGVTSYYPGDGYVEGEQGYQMSDVDGYVVLSFDEVDVSSAANANLSINYFLPNMDSYGSIVTWESDDYLKIWMTTNTGDVSIFNTEGSDIDDLGITGSWQQVTVVLAGYTTAQLHVGFSSNASSESVYFDDIKFYDGNLAPVANAGQDIISETNASITLDGSGSSDSDGTIENWLWTQLTGTTVTLSTVNDTVATFTTPASDTELSFELQVTDNIGATAKDTVNISVVTVSESSVIISEYIEGETGNEKFLEIYNAGDTSIDLIANGYSIGATHNGDGDFSYATFDDWGAFSILEPGNVIVIGADEATRFTPDIALAYPSPVHFNGNDAVALLQNGVVVDIVGFPTDDTYQIPDMTLRRNNNVTVGSTIFDWNEWTELLPADISGLGVHAGAAAPLFGTPVLKIGESEFLTSGTQIIATVDITPAEGGTISSVTLAYGAAGVFPYEVQMGLYSGSTYMGAIPAQDPNYKMDYKIVADGYESSTYTAMIASSTPTAISDIHTNIGTLDGTVTTIQGVVTIGVNLLQTGLTKAYIQDASGRGLNIYHADVYDDIIRGTEILLVGEVDLYNTTVEIADFTYQVIATDQTVPAAVSVSIAEANSSDWEGTLIEFSGVVTDAWDGGYGFIKFTVADVSDETITTDVMSWQTNGLDLSAVVAGTHNTFKGVGSAYQGAYQLLIAYIEDLSLLTSVDNGQSLPNDFKLYAAYPNPFNPATTLALDIPEAGDISVSIYDISGRLVSMITRNNVQAGHHEIIWNAGQYSSGIYMMKVQTASAVAFQKVTLIK